MGYWFKKKKKSGPFQITKLPSVFLLANLYSFLEFNKSLWKSYLEDEGFNFRVDHVNKPKK